MPSYFQKGRRHGGQLSAKPPAASGQLLPVRLRGVGKSTWARQHFPTAPRVDLLDEGRFQAHRRQPERFCDELRLPTIVETEFARPQLLWAGIAAAGLGTLVLVPKRAQKYAPPWRWRRMAGRPARRSGGNDEPNGRGVVPPRLRPLVANQPEF
jgi:hypothetical protein